MCCVMCRKLLGDVDEANAEWHRCERREWSGKTITMKIYSPENENGVDKARNKVVRFSESV